MEAHSKQRSLPLRMHESGRLKYGQKGQRVPPIPLIGSTPVGRSKAQKAPPDQGSDAEYYPVLESRSTMGASTPNIAAPATPISMTPIVESAAKSIMRAVSSINVGSLAGDASVSSRTLPHRKSSSSQRDSVISGTSTSSLGKDGSVIELSQELTPMRPLRPDNESKNRPPSGHLKQVRVLTVTPSTSPLDSPQPDGAGIRNNAELPPPLPEKSSQADYANIATDYPDSSVYDVQCLMRRGTHKDRPHIPLPTTPTQPLPPKKNSTAGDTVLKTRSLQEEDNNF